MILSLRTGLIALALPFLIAAAPVAGDNPLLSASGPAVNIEADGALEWHRAENIYLARGHVKITRGDTTLTADKVVVHYRTPASGKGVEIWQLTADDDVVITSPTAKITGGHGVYVIDSQTAILTGGNLKLATKTDMITARQSLEYHGAANKAFARGSARATRGDNTLAADVLEATLGRNAKGQMELKTVTATGGVVITTPSEVVRGETGRYDLAANTARLDGGVKLTRGETQLNGQSAEVDMATGISRLTAAPGSGGRVRALFVPGQDAPPLPGMKP